MDHESFHKGEEFAELNQMLSMAHQISELRGCYSDLFTDEENDQLRKAIEIINNKVYARRYEINKERREE